MQGQRKLERLPWWVYSTIGGDLLCFLSLFLLFAFSSVSSLQLLSNEVSSIALSNAETKSLNVDIPVDLSILEASSLADGLSLNSYTANFQNAKASIPGPFVVKGVVIDRIIVSPTDDVHLNPNGETVVDDFELNIDAPSFSCIASPSLEESFKANEAIEVGGLGLTIDAFALDKGNGSFFERTVGTYLIIPSTLAYEGELTINFDLSAGISSTSAYLSLLNEHGLLDGELIFNTDADTAPLEKALSSYLDGNGLSSPVLYGLSSLIGALLIALNILVFHFKKPEPLTLLLFLGATFVPMYLILQIVDSFVPAFNLVGAVPVLFSLGAAIVSIAAIYLLQAIKRRKPRKEEGNEEDPR